MEESGGKTNAIWIKILSTVWYLLTNQGIMSPPIFVSWDKYSSLFWALQRKSRILFWALFWVDHSQEHFFERSFDQWNFFEHFFEDSKKWICSQECFFEWVYSFEGFFECSKKRSRSSATFMDWGVAVVGGQYTCVFRRSEHHEHPEKCFFSDSNHSWKYTSKWTAWYIC